MLILNKIHENLLKIKTLEEEIDKLKEENTSMLPELLGEKKSGNFDMGNGETITCKITPSSTETNFDDKKLNDELHKNKEFRDFVFENLTISIKQPVTAITALSASFSEELVSNITVTKAKKGSIKIELVKGK